CHSGRASRASPGEGEPESSNRRPSCTPGGPRLLGPASRSPGRAGLAWPGRQSTRELLAMRDLARDHRWLSINTATVRKRGDLIPTVEACAGHGIRAISPWRDQVAQVGLERAVRAVRDAGLELSGYCRGGMFTGDKARAAEIRDDNRRAVD